MQEFGSHSDAALLAATAQEPEAFGEFYARHEDAVLYFFLRRGARPGVQCSPADDKARLCSRERPVGRFFTFRVR